MARGAYIWWSKSLQYGDIYFSVMARGAYIWWSKSLDPGPAALGCKVLGQAAGNVSSQCVGILIVHQVVVVHIRCFWVLFIVQVRVLTEELVYKSRVQPLLPPSDPPLPSSLPPSLPQILNIHFLFCETIHLFILLFWITAFIILFVDMLRGAVYANYNAFSISVEVRYSINVYPHRW